MRRTSDKSQLRNILGNTGLRLLKSAKVIKKKKFFLRENFCCQSKNCTKAKHTRKKTLRLLQYGQKTELNSMGGEKRQESFRSWDELVEKLLEDTRGEKLSMRYIKCTDFLEFASIFL